MRRTPLTLKSELLAATVPYNWIFSFFGLTLPYSIFSAADAGKRKRLCLFSAIYLMYSLLIFFLAIWITHVNYVAYYETVSDHRLDTITEVLGVSQSLMVVVTQFVIQVWMLFGYGQLYKLRVNIAQLEEDVRVNCELNAAIVSLSKFRGRFAKRTGMLLFFVLIGYFYVRYNLLRNQLEWPGKVVTDFKELLIQIKCAEFCLWVQLLHEILMRLKVDLLYLRRQLVRCKRPTERYWIYRCLQLNQHFVARAWGLSKAIESYFAIPLLMLFLQNGLVITHVVNWAYIMSAYATDFYQLLRASEAVILLFNILVPCWLSQLCINSYNDFGNSLLKFKSDGTDLKLSMRIREYSLQLMQQKVVFTCGGYFDVNLKNFGGLMLTIITYVVILIQFKLQSETERKRAAQT